MRLWLRSFSRLPEMSRYNQQFVFTSFSFAATADTKSLDQDRVDELLIKITEVGRDKLTEEELGILKQASERLRQMRKK